MARERYVERVFRGESKALVDRMNIIVADYQRQGFVLTVRQMYYQLVARAVVPNTEKSYKRVTGLVNDARMAGEMDWDAIEDRTRAFERRPHWESGGDILAAVAQQFHVDMWENQPYRVFVLVEKEALAGVLSGVCREFDVPLLAARGYPSVTVLREFAKSDLRDADLDGKRVLVLHLGDHDPSGIDMTRDLEDRIGLLRRGRGDVEIRRIALNMAQVKEHNPPPNPAKTTDSRFETYLKEYGDESWELDALEPALMVSLVRRSVEEVIERGAWSADEARVETTRARLGRMAARWKN